jgi:maltooligosyltrehalose trehalohydrolase
VKKPEVRSFYVEKHTLLDPEFRLDGLRIDASHAMMDESPKHILDEIADRIHTVTRGRSIHLVLEDQENVARRLMRHEDGSPVTCTAQRNQDMTHLPRA